MSRPAPSPIGGPPREAAGPVTTQSEVDSLQRRIRQTREELGQTVSALTAKTQVKARARNKAAAVAGRARHSAAMTRLRECHLVGRIRESAPVARVRGYDPAGRIRRADLGGRVRQSGLAVRVRSVPTPLVVVGLVAGLTITVVLVRRRRRTRSAHRVR
jgi:hypothetical protein